MYIAIPYGITQCYLPPGRGDIPACLVVYSATVCCPGNAGDSPVLGHLSRDTATVTRPAYVVALISTTFLLQLLTSATLNANR